MTDFSLANCLGVHPDTMIPAKHDMAGWRNAKAICKACVIRPGCLREHLDEQHGCFGGSSPAERQQLRGQRGRPA